MKIDENMKPFIPRDKPKSWIIGILAGLTGLLIAGNIRGSPIKRLLSTAKTFPVQEKKVFSSLAAFSHQYRYHCRNFYLF
ncbi:MAG: hypothetical protein PHP95_02780, partial [Desulfuromonadaceae bacterium]|nr:hypothetical protein [Desulfuromonadaceae bacterium]MDD2847359.1 hypothetical protein [Desulfuromonadaceae bacterium]MDD4131528.1 hypothetical protein [Desulfuromonadaceae bacterium]